MHLKVFTKCQMLCHAYDDMSGFSILNTRGVTRIIINFHFLRCIKFESSLLNSPLYMLPKNFAFISGMRSNVMELAELIILQLIRGQHDMIIGQLDLPLLKQEIEELV